MSKRRSSGGRLKIKWTVNALRQLERVHRFYAEFDRRLAARIFRTIQFSVRRLARFPSSGRQGQVAGTFELVFQELPFVVVYRIEGDEIQILRVIHTSTDWKVGAQ
jgi:toxin ParE1/3/4